MQGVVYYGLWLSVAWAGVIIVATCLEAAAVAAAVDFYRSADTAADAAENNFMKCSSCATYFAESALASAVALNTVGGVATDSDAVEVFANAAALYTSTNATNDLDCVKFAVIADDVG